MSSHTLSPLYAPYFTPEEKRSIRRLSGDDISSEINLLRKLIVLFMQFQQSAPADLVSSIQALRTCTLLCEQLAILVRVQDLYHPEEIPDPLMEALKEVPFFLDDRTD
ncbi:MAG: hypothetical protein ABSF99_10150 [Anaerolineales bacterium]|jgi:hypothetical protein